MFGKIKCSKCKKPIARKVVETETVETEYHEYDRQKIELYIYTDYNTDEIKYRVDGFLTYYKYIVTIPLSKIAQDFVASELYEKRQILIKLFIDL